MTLDDNVKNLEEETNIQIKERSELGEVMDSLESDKFDPNTKSSSIDFNARLDHVEISCITIMDELTRLGIFPSDTGLTRQKKRLSVSLQGKGREEKVQIVQGERQNRSSGGFMQRLGNVFRPQE